MTTSPLEILLARLFADLDEAEQFLQDRESYAKRYGLTAEQLTGLREIDAAALRFAARSFERKRRSRGD
jgi:hypothetical protein